MTCDALVVVGGLTATGNSLGLSVDHSANLAHYFAVAWETKKEAHPRAHHDDSVWRLSLSVFHGGFSTIVAVLLLVVAVSTVFGKLFSRCFSRCWQ